MTAAVVRTTPEADAHILKASAWWRVYRTAAPDLFDEELAGALALLAGSPDIGRRYRRPHIPGLRRLLLPRTRYHAYYVHDPRKAEVVVQVSCLRSSANKPSWLRVIKCPHPPLSRAEQMRGRGQLAVRSAHLVGLRAGGVLSRAFSQRGRGEDEGAGRRRSALLLPGFAQRTSETGH